MTSLLNFIKQLFKIFLLSSAAVMGMIVTLSTGLIILIAFFAVIAAAGSAATEDLTTSHKVAWGEEDAAGTLLAIDINGVILGEQLDLTGFSSLLQEGLTYGYDVKEELIKAAEDDTIAGVILMIDSPGGTIFGSQAIADGVSEYKEKTGKPVIAYVGGTAASGSYWAAVSTDEILADHGTAIGSIGVIYGPFKYYQDVVSEDGGAFMGGVVTQGGITTQYITAGTSKDIGNPYRQLSAAEVASLQETVNDSYEEFVSMVATHRGIEAEQIRTQIGAMIYGEKQAVERKLIDKVANKHQAFDELASKASLDLDDYKVIKKRAEGDFFSEVLGATTLALGSRTAQSGTHTPITCTLTSQVLAFHGDISRLCN